MQDFEKLGVFYLGRTRDPDAPATVVGEPLLYDARDLTTHAVIVGMTGSGKTGLALSLIEEAAIDGIPALLIDPKGDLGNLLLQFPELRPADFRPWIDPAEAARKGLSPDAFAAQTAESWRSGLAAWGQDGARLARLRDAAEFAVYTPGNTSVRPLQVLRSFAAPPEALRQDASALRERVLNAVAGLLGLLGLDADPVRSREQILLANIFDTAWRAGRDLDLAGIIQAVQKPPFDKVGVFDVDAFFPARERFGLAMSLNNLLASPGFSAWVEGEPLDIQRLLYTSDGRPRVAILSIAHLPDAERMFFVTLFLNEVLAWMRTQSGTSSLRALLYMDEIFGYFPPTANPPSKLPMLTLLKQARAFGLGVVLSTQNPVDLDYKGLANAGTWMIGRLQSERDQLRLLDGLEGALAGAGAAFDRARIGRLLSGLGPRVFLMHNVHEDQPVLFESRWALSYLRGPLTLPQLRQLAAPTAPVSAVPPAPAAAPVAPAPEAVAAAAARPVLPPGLSEGFVRSAQTPAAGIVYRPTVQGVSKLHFVDAAAGIDTWLNYTYRAPLDGDGFALWECAERITDAAGSLEREPLTDAAFAPLPGPVRTQSAETWRRTLVSHLYQNVVLELPECPELKLCARPGESEGDFRTRAAQTFREQRDVEVERLRQKYAPRLRTLQDQLRRARERVEREQAQASQQKLNTAIGFGATLLGALLGRRVVSASSVGRAATTMRSAGRIGKEPADVARAGESVQVLEERLAALEQQFDADTAALQGRCEPAPGSFPKRLVRPRKSDIAVGSISLCWAP